MISSLKTDIVIIIIFFNDSQLLSAKDAPPPLQNYLENHLSEPVFISVKMDFNDYCQGSRTLNRAAGLFGGKDGPWPVDGAL